jgi:nicotinate dehydrogenase subunit A
MMTEIQLSINGVARTVDIDPSTPLIYVLRNQLGLTGAKLACGLEQCGACTVLVDGEAQLSCVSPVGQFEGTEIVTVEGLMDGEEPGPVQRAFIDEGAAQCGYCTPGLVIAVEALRRREQAPDKAGVCAALGANLCRCGTHAAVLRAAERVLGRRGG